MTQPLVSVMMPAYNAAHFIGEAIGSMLAQSYPCWELVVVDDGSTDDTAHIVKHFDDPRIKLVQQANGGEAVARNTALQHMTGELVSFLDADDVFLPQHLAITVNYLVAHPELDAVYTDGYYCDQQGNRLQPLSSQRRGPFQGALFEEVVRASDVFGPPTCVVLRRNLVEAHDLRFDPAIVIGPDWDFLTRYAEWAQFGYIDEHSCLYRVHDTNVTVRVDLERRALYLARCREKAVQLAHFNDCSLETRWAVFYDLLVALLTGHPERQSSITTRPAFTALPSSKQAHLLRLMAADAIMKDNVPADYVSAWLRRARQLAPADWRAALLFNLYRISPGLARRFLGAKRNRASTPLSTSPFGNLH